MSSNLNHELLMVYRVYSQSQKSDTKTDLDFKVVREAIKARRIQLTRAGGGNKPNRARRLEEDEVRCLFESGHFSIGDPYSLQRGLWFLLTIHFGLRGRDEAQKMKWGDVTLQIDGSRKKFLQWGLERGAKTRQGETGLKNCPVMFYLEYSRRRPDGF